MIQIPGENTEMHSIKNPGQAVFLIVLILIVFVGLSVGIGYAVKKIL